MNPEYVKDVRRFASSGRLRDEEGQPRNLSHDQDINWREVVTDGLGNVIRSPLIFGKLCIGRPERRARGHRSGRTWTDERGLHRSETYCDRCADLSPGIYRACGVVVDERINSNPSIASSFDAWLTASGSHSGPRCFTRVPGERWKVFVQAIIDHGGWTNTNDDQVKLEALRLKEEKRQKRNATAKAARTRKRDARRGARHNNPLMYIRALETERDNLADIIKGLRTLSGRCPQDMLWLKNLRDENCERIADVWFSRQLLSHTGHKLTGRAIAEDMVRRGRSYGLSVISLTTRVYDDLKRIAKFEDATAGPPIWAPSKASKA